MPPPGDSRRKYITLLAVESKDGTLSCEVLISFDRMQAVGRRSLGQARECGYIGRWEKADPDNIRLPVGYETRFKQRLL